MTPQNKLILENYINSIEKCLDNLVEKPSENCLQKDVLNAMKYSLSAGGKRIRPVLVMEFCRICGGNPNDALPAAAALEMVHTFSLIHDDLPCMDNDDFRRGKPSCHKAFGEATALLAGDALLNSAFSVIAKTNLPPKTVLELVADLSENVGVNGMTGGQVIDIKFEGKPITEEILLKMYSLKTGALLKTACRMGCICANATAEQLDLATLFAEKFGLTFQIIDDILDVTSTQETLGKPIGSDAAQNKTTFVTLFGLEKSVKTAEKLTNESLNILEKFPNNEFLKDLTKSLVIRNK
ncbi:MAG: polyprenyl synthetase family protein [Oscillospiraceae bacterium]